MDIIQKAYKFRIYPNQDQQTLIAKTIGSCRYIFNHFLNKWNITYKTSNKGLSYSECSKELPILKIQLPWLKEVDSTALQTTLRHLDIAFKNFFKKQNGYPKFKSKRNKTQSYTSKFSELLCYKANWCDKTVIKVGKFFPSSQLCSSCGYKNTKVKNLSVRKWTCPKCQTKHDRDLNASINILNEGLRIALQSGTDCTVKFCI